MLTADHAGRELLALPLHERQERLRELLVEQFQRALLMDADEEFPTEESYFDLGLTSLGLSEVKDRLEERLGCEISTTTLFNSPTVDRLLAYLIAEPLADLFDQSGTPGEAQSLIRSSD